MGTYINVTKDNYNYLQILLLLFLLQHPKKEYANTGNTILTIIKVDEMWYMTYFISQRGSAGQLCAFNT